MPRGWRGEKKEGVQGETANLHDVDLLGGPRVHVQAADKAEVHAQAAVQAAALVADEDAQRRGRPLWVRRPALGAKLCGVQAAVRKRGNLCRGEGGCLGRAKPGSRAPA